MANGQSNGNELMAFKIPRDINLKRNLCVLKLPNRWLDKFTALWPTPSGELGPRIPFRSLADTLKLLAPDLMYIEDSLYQNRIVENGWLYGSNEIHAEALLEIVGSWIRNNSGKEDRAMFDKKADVVIDSLDSSDLKWDRAEIDFGNFEDGPGEVPNISADKYFEAFAHVVCNSLAGREFVLGDSGEVLRFTRAFSGRRSHLISWPPERSEGPRSGTPWYWSYVIEPRVYQVPGSLEPFLNMNVRISRWVSESLSYESPSGGERNNLPVGNTNVYAKVLDHWISGLDVPRSLVQVPLRVVPKSFKLEWASSIEEILRDIRVEDRLPNPWNLVRAPEEFLDRGGSQFAITYGPRMTRVRHSVSPGVPLIDRRQLFEAADPIFGNWGMEQIDPTRSVSIPRALPNRISAMRRRIDDQDPTLRAATIRSELGDRLRIEAVVQEDSMFEAIRGSIRQLLGVNSFIRQGADAVLGGDAVIETGEEAGLTVELVSNRLGDVGAMLADGQKATFDSRVELIGRRFPSASVPTVSLVELENHGGKDGDPKRVLRHGLARAGRNTQFITPLTEDRDHNRIRVRNAVIDIIRQTGMLPGNIVEPRRNMAASIPPNLNAMALYVHRVGRGLLPVFVHVSGPGYLEQGSKSSIKVRFPVLPGQPRKFISYRKAQLALGSGTVWRPIKDDKVPAFIEEVFDDLIHDQEAPLLFIGDAGNLGRPWEWFQDSRTRFDKPILPNGRSLAVMDGLRIVRIRSAREYVPLWFNPEDRLQSSLLELPGEGRAFYSIAQKAMTMRDYRDQRHLSKRDNPFAVRVAPATKEITLLHKQNGDVPREWAIAVHRMREMAVTYDDSLGDPLPLFLAEQMKEYIDAPRIHGQSGK